MKYKIKEFLTFKERELLLEQPNQKTLLGLRDFTILALMVLTGLRRKEICDLDRGQLKEHGKKIYLYILGKGDRMRKIRISDPYLLDALTKYFEKIGTLKDPYKPMFFINRGLASENPKRITPATIRFLIKRYVKAAGIQKRITPHSLRHTFLTLALLEGAALSTVQRLAGHSNISTTSRYLHTTEELKEKAIESLHL